MKSVEDDRDLVYREADGMDFCHLLCFIRLATSYYIRFVGRSSDDI